jgi:hypothetical protein
MTMTQRPSGLVAPRAAAGVIPFHGENVNIGPGLLWVAAVGADEPDGVHGGPDALQPAGQDGTDFDETQWVPLGFTSEGSTFSYAIDSSPIEVAESLLPIRTMTTAVTMTMAFALAEITAYNIQVALNGGSTVPIPGQGNNYVEFVPPRAGQEVRVALGWDRDDGLERMILRQCIQTGSVDIARQKAPNFATLPVTFTVEVPPGGLDPLVWSQHISILGGPPASTPFPPPTLTGLNPVTGDPAGGDALVLTGTNLTGATGVRFGTTAMGTAFSVVNATTINVTTPAHAAATVDVVVLHPSGNATLANGFEFA